MSSQLLFARILKASFAFVLLHAALISFPAVMSGDANSIQSLLLMGSGLSFSILVVLFVLVLPLYIALGSSETGSDASRKIRWPLAGALSVMAFGCFFVFGFELKPLSILAVAGAACGFGLSLMNKEPRRWAVN
jgi:hypothetical protein